MSFRIAHLSVPKAGERENGDAVLVRTEDSGRLMLAVVDGLGHGPTAAAVAQKAIARLRTLSWDLAMLDVMLAVHHELSGTIGASATVCTIRGRMVDACAVGNVQLTCSGWNIPFLPSAGVLGRHVSKFHVCRGELRPRSWLALFTDGISRRLSLADARALTPEAACKAFIARFRQRDDDATVLVCNFED